MPFEFKVTRQVEFADTDMAGIVHFSAFFRYMENTEHAFYRSLGYSVCGSGGKKEYGWPRVHAECDFVASLRFEEMVEIQLLVAEKGESSLSYDFMFRKVGVPAGPMVARGRLVVVHVTIDPATGKMTKSPIPEALARQIESAPQEKLSAGDCQL
jgi:YbgC/YbaW family acyl-CoA thioester hydrolase